MGFEKDCVLKMDYCCSMIKNGTHLPKLNRGDVGLRNGDEGFLKGEKIRGSLNGTVWVNHVQKRLGFEKQIKKITKPGVAFSVITSDSGKETLVEVILHHLFISFLKFFSICLEGKIDLSYFFGFVFDS